jgi:hypothetical protein
MNSRFSITPYKFQGFWLFDDPSVGIQREPLTGGADHFLDFLTEGIPNATRGCRLEFSNESFPGHTAHFTRSRPQYGGYSYSWAERGLEGWFGPAFLKHFESVPADLYVKVSAKPH